ncbi:MAG: ubiquitin-like protein Pup [Demequinaceae bacterium]|nr:ubiquitin-like protein Pup [Demequinaceae bacterium]
MPQVSSSEHPYDEPDDAPATSPGGVPQAQANAVDALLDEIDVTLQQNAEQFVRSFVQKGGE